MCGIFGYIHQSPDELLRSEFEDKLRVLFLNSQSRGKQAAGLAVATDNALLVHKDSIPAEEMIKTKGYKDFISRVWESRGDKAAPISIIGHTRLVTNGTQVVDANNQPVTRGRVAMVHNGIITNPDVVWDASKMERNGEVDTQSAAAFVESSLNRGQSLMEISDALLDIIYGESTFAMLFADRHVYALTSNTGSCFTCVSNEGTEFFFVSERNIANNVIENKLFRTGFSKDKVVQLKPNKTLCLNTLTLEPMAHDDLESSPSVAPMLQTFRRIEEKSERLKDIRKNLKRCTRCILPETMPFIRYDDQGVCSYCHAYKPIQYKGMEALRVRLEDVAAKSGEADCILAFSGGRDSSWGMHIMVEELGLNPIAFSFDWGMVTDLGRRNQARMCGALGVEHIWISADIKAKRDNIRRNLHAWMKRPRLGMIPLLMAGDKHFFYHANQTMKNTGLNHMFMCSNSLEITDFKVGFTNTMPKSLRKNADVDHMHSLPLSSVVTLAAYYGKEAFLNPSYFNRSVPDSLTAYFSYYLMKQDHIDIFQYLEWKEDDCDKVLGQYDWERQDGADSSWRIGDGTAPFYNYIYNEVGGFSEFDTLRSNQIREGHLTREEALALAENDNQPRFEYIREYCQLINVDFEDCVRVVNRMPKLYET